MKIETVSNITPKAILKTCQAFDIDQDSILSEAGIQKDLLNKINGRVAIEDVTNLWEIVARKTEQRMIGILASNSLKFGAFKVIDYLMISSSTLRENLVKSSKHYALLNNAHKLSLIVKDNSAYIELEYSKHNQDMQTYYTDFIFASLLNRIRMANSDSWNPKEIHLICSQPKDVSVYHQFYRSPVLFNKSVNRIVIDKQLIDIQQPNADPFLSEMLEFYAQNQMKQIPNEKDLLYEIRKVLYQGIRKGETDLDSVAKKLAIGRRNLQRQLNSYGISHRSILDGVRSEIAQSLLKTQNVNIDEIAYLVGYSETSSFFRAFKRWTNKTPQKFLSE